MSGEMCKFCDQSDEFVNAHILPDSFYEHVRSDTGHYQLVTNAAGAYGRTASTGVYDPKLLCRRCEERFAPLDAFGKRFFVDNDYESRPHPDRPDTCLEIRGVDYKQLRLFLLWYLWRAIATARREYHNLNHNDLLPALKDHLERGDPDPPESFAMVLGKFDGPAEVWNPEDGYVPLDPRGMFLDPHPEEVQGMELLRLYLLDFTLTVYIGGAPLQRPLEPLILRPDQPIRVCLRRFVNSPELKLMYRMCRESPPRRSSGEQTETEGTIARGDDSRL